MNAPRPPLFQVADTLGRLPLFNGFARDGLIPLASACEPVVVAKDQLLFRRGDTAQAMYVVISGKLKVFLPRQATEQKLVTLAESGDCLAVAAAYLREIHVASAQAKTDCHLIALRGDVLRQQSRQDAKLACRLLETVSRRVLGLLHDLDSCTTRSSLQRVCCYLLRHRPRPSVAQYDVLLSISKRELATQLNLAEETLSRVLHQLIRDGAIEVNGRRIWIQDADSLMRMHLSGCQSGEMASAA